MNLFNEFKNKKLVFKDNGKIIDYEECFISYDNEGNTIHLKVNGEWLELLSDNENDIVEIYFE